jgi:ABC-2 type transport system permease protein
VFWIPALFAYIVISTAFYERGLIFIFVNAALTFSMVFSILIIDDKYRVETFFISLPLKRRKVVYARYLSSGFIIFLGLLFYFFTSFLLDSFIPIDIVDFMPLISPEGAAVFLIPVVLLTLIFLPMYFRLGLGKALLFFPVVIMVGAGIFWILLPGVNKLEKLYNTFGAPLIIFIAVLVLSSLVFASIIISIRFYSRKEF